MDESISRQPPTANRQPIVLYDPAVRYRVALAAIVLLALAAIAHSWTVFSQVIDEPAHVAAGLEWLDTGTYALDPQHPPLARIVVALGPMLRGATYEALPHWLFAGNAILYGNGSYVATLASARAGTLVFFLLSCAIAFVWTRKLYGVGAATAALLLFATQPTVLGHAALATTDMAAAATILAALFALHVWLERPTMGRAVLLGIAIAAALTTKFSAVVFLPAGAVAVLWSGAAPLLTISLAIAVAIVGVFAVYRFQPGFFEGIAEVRAHNRGGHPSYLFGEVRREGWWFYFPVALWFKSTIPLLLAFAYGAYLILRKRGASPVPLAASGPATS